MNTEIFLWLYRIGTSSQIMSKIVVWFARYAQYVVLACVIIFLYIQFRHHKKVIQEIVIITTTTVAAWVVSAIIKLLVQAPRPFLAVPHVQPLFTYGGYNSFPSGHAATFFALAMAIYFYHKPAGILFFVFAFLIAVCRVIAGIHFPIDIFIGAIIGILIASFLHRYVKKFCQVYLFGKKTIQ